VKELFPNLIPIEGEHGKKSYIKYIGNLDKITERRILDKSNEIILEDLEIKTEFVTLEELKKRSPWVPEHLPTNKPLRIMQIGNFPPIPDGGTQLGKTREAIGINTIEIVNEAEQVFVYYKANDLKLTQDDNEISGGNTITREDLMNIKNYSIAQVGEVKSLEDLEKIRIDLFGKNGKITQLTKELKNLNTEEKRQIGSLINEIKKTLEQVILEKKEEFNVHTRIWFDPTIPVKAHKIGKLHPTSVVISEMTGIFKNMGFSVFEGPEIETDHYNFELLNLPKDHPARSLQDVLYIKEPETLLRSHTSSVETRAIEKLKPPFRVVVAGKCYRFEAVNASNNAMFYQFQGFALQEGLSMADLKGTLFHFVKSYFGEKRKIRYRCKYYPEVEPGVGLDIDCAFCGQKGCSVCKGRGWIEMLGAGMIHPNILKNFGYDPKKVTGFAFGMGLDRIVMDRFGIRDIRSLYNGDISH
jgi:phenylalanyl-tRNA synthetase alpha chain